MSRRSMLPALAHVNAANAITSLSLVSAAGALLLLASGHVVVALCVGALSLVCDIADGAVARRMGTTSAFGAQLDSLCDAVSFGVLPAVVGYALGVDGAASVVLVLYAWAALWRLARFAQMGLQTDARGRPCFEGVPTPFAAAVFYVVAAAGLFLPDDVARASLIAFYVVAAVAMNAGFAFPKTGLHTRAMWVLTPAALVAALAWS